MLYLFVFLLLDQEFAGCGSRQVPVLGLLRVTGAGVKPSAAWPAAGVVVGQEGNLMVFLQNIALSPKVSCFG